eukprot:scaffold86000_cov23-Prasinocladus_malaysianus.AAC.1
MQCSFLEDNCDYICCADVIQSRFPTAGASKRAYGYSAVDTVLVVSPLPVRTVTSYELARDASFDFRTSTEFELRASTSTENKVVQVRQPLAGADAGATSSTPTRRKVPLLSRISDRLPKSAKARSLKDRKKIAPPRIKNLSANPGSPRSNSEAVQAHSYSYRVLAVLTLSGCRSTNAKMSSAIASRAALAPSLSTTRRAPTARAPKASGNTQHSASTTRETRPPSPVLVLLVR